MKQKQNIEELMQHLKSAYKVPENYFEELNSDFMYEDNKKAPSKKTFSTLSIAASILLIFGLSLYWFAKKDEISLQDKYESPTHVSVNEDAFFNDIDEEIIEDYIVENGLIDEIYIESETNN